MKKKWGGANKFTLTIPSYVNFAATNEVEDKLPITHIDKSVFSGKTEITALCFEEDPQLKSIGESAFMNCTELMYIELPESITSIGIKAFSGNKQLGIQNKNGEPVTYPELNLPTKLEIIGSKAFEKCIALTKVKIPKTVKTVLTSSGNNAGPFYYCDNLSDITIEDGMEIIPAHLFEGRILPTTQDANLEYIEYIEFKIPDSVIEIGDAAFLNQVNMKRCEINTTTKLERIGEESFSNCPSLEYIHLSKKMTKIGKNAFAGAKSLFSANAVGNNNEDAILEIPDKVALGKMAFRGCTSIKKIYIPKDVNYNEGTSTEGPFYNCSNVEEIVLEEGRTEIPECLFYGNISTEPILEIVIPDSVVTIKGHSFQNNKSLKKIILGENTQLSEISSYAFSSCHKLESFILPNTLTKISTGAFSGCDSFTNITIPASVTDIGEGAFKNSDILESVEFEVNNFYTKKQNIGNDLFLGCPKLKTVKLGNKIDNIPGSTFSGCISLEEVEIPFGVKTIYGNAFYNCNALRSLFIPSSVTTINTKKSELAYCYEQGLKIYVEKGDSTAVEFAKKNEFNTEVGIYRTAEEFIDKALLTQMSTQRFDKNLDTRLTLRELEKIIDINLSSLEIVDMTGTQLFTKLKSINCSNNKITTLNTSAWNSLETLNCANNQLLTLDLSNNPLKNLNCENNNILVFDLKGVKTLENVTLGTQTATLATSYNDTYKEYLLPLKEKYTIYDKNQISEISDKDIGKPNNEGLIWNDAYGVPDRLTYKYTTTYGAATSQTSAFVKIEITNAGIELTKNQYPDAFLLEKMKEILDTNKNGLVSKTEEGDCKSLDLKTVGIYSLDGIQRVINLETLDCSGNEIKTLDISKNTALSVLNCENNKIREINIKSNLALRTLKCANNKLSKLNLSDNSLLEELECGNNKIAAIDVQKNPSMDTIRSGNQEFAILKELKNGKAYVNLIEYDEFFNNALVTKTTAYLEGSALSLQEGEIEFLADGTLVMPAYVDKIVYEYRVSSGFPVMNVTMHITDKLDEEIEEKTNINELIISEFTDKMYTGIETTQAITIYDASYMLREWIDYNVKYEKNIEVGSAKVIITGLGAYEGRCTGNYEIIPEWNITVKNIVDQKYENKKLTPPLSVKLNGRTLRNDVDYKAEFINNKNVGVATIKIEGIGQYIDAGMKETSFNIIEGSIAKTTCYIDEQTYDTNAKEPVPVVRQNGILVKDVDYTVSYSKNIKAGKAVLTLKGIGNYTGIVNKTFNINKIDISKLSDDKIEVGAEVPFNVLGAKAAVSLSTESGIVLTEGTDYTVSYSANKKIGTAKVTIKGKGSCSGRIDKTFEVTAQDIKDSSVQIKVAVAQKSTKTIKPTITITQNNKKLREGEKKDYTISYDVDATLNSGVVVVTIKGQNNYCGETTTEFIIVDKLINKAKISGLKSAEYDGEEKEQSEEDIMVMIGKEEVPTNCYELSYAQNVKIGSSASMTVTALPENCNYEFGGSVTAKFKITPVKFTPSKEVKRVTAQLQDDQLIYTGEKQMPTVIVSDEQLNKVLVEGVDYKVICTNNQNVGTKGTSRIVGMGGYSGTITLSFSIVPKDMTNDEKDFRVVVRNSAYTAKTITPRITIMEGKNLLKINKDYTFDIEPTVEQSGFAGKIKAKGKYIITISGKGNYTGSLSEYHLYVY